MSPRGDSRNGSTGWFKFLRRIQAEEDHRWTQINTDRDCPKSLFALARSAHSTVTLRNGGPTPESNLQYLCLSVSICGCIEWSRLSHESSVINVVGLFTSRLTAGCRRVRLSRRL